MTVNSPWVKFVRPEDHEIGLLGEGPILLHFDGPRPLLAALSGIHGASERDRASDLQDAPDEAKVLVEV